MTSLTGEWLLQAELEEMARRPYTPPVTDPPGVPPLKSPRPTPEYPGGVPQDPPPVPVAPPVDLTGLPSGGWEIPGKKKTGMGSLTPEEVDALIDANPGAEDLIRRKYQQEKKSVEGFPLAELNPAQIEALKKIPANIKDLPDAERLQRMREITDEVKGLA